MSMFYRRYLNALAKKASSKPEIKSEVSPPTTSVQKNIYGVDSSSNAQPPAAARPSPAKTVRFSTANGGPERSSVARSRRMQIFSTRVTSGRLRQIVPPKVSSYSKPEESKTFLKNVLSRHYLFSSLSVDDMDRMIDSMQPLYVNTNEIITQQGEFGTSFYCVERGSVNVKVNDEVVNIHESGECFGELALIYNTARTANVMATSPSLLWMLDLCTFRYISTTTVSSTIVNRCEFFRGCDYFDKLSNQNILKLANTVESKTIANDTIIVKQGTTQNVLYLIESGIVKCVQTKATGEQVVLMTLKEGDYVGEAALLYPNNAQKQLYSCVAVDSVSLLALDVTTVESALLPVLKEIFRKREYIRVFQTVQLLSRLPPKKMIQLQAGVTSRTFADGETIFRQGDPGNSFMVILEGSVRCVLRGGGSRKESTEGAVLGPLDCLGERCLVAKEARRFDAVCKGPVTCLLLGEAHFQLILEEVESELVSALRRTSVVDPEDDVPTVACKYEDLKKIRTIGTGTFGRVLLVQDAVSQATYAMKSMNKVDIIATSQEENIFSERDVVRMCAKCPFVINLITTFNLPDQVCMVLEFVQGGELWSYIYEEQKAGLVPRNDSGTGFHIDAARFYAANVILAFEYLHKKNIVFRDLKPENLVLDRNGYLKLVDFGFAQVLPYLRDGQYFDKMFTLCGTAEYLAPEVILQKGYDRGVDQWAIGCFIYELVYGFTPFRDEDGGDTQAIFDNIVCSQDSLQFPSHADPHLESLIRGLLEVNPVFRLGNQKGGGMENVRYHPFFASVDWDCVGGMTLPAPYVPAVSDVLDCSNFDEYEEDDEVPQYDGDQDLFAQF